MSQEKDLLLNQLIDKFDLTENDYSVVTMIMEGNDYDFDSCVSSLRDMGYRSETDEDIEVEIMPEIQQMKDIFHGHDGLTETIMQAALDIKGGEVENAIEMVFKIAGNPNDVETLRNGSESEKFQLEEFLRKQADEQFEQQQRKLMNEIRREKEAMLGLQKELVNELKTHLKDSEEAPDVPVTAMDPFNIVDSLILIEASANEMMEKLAEKIPTSAEANTPKSNELVNRLAATFANAKAKEELVKKITTQNSKCLLSVNTDGKNLAVTFHLKAMEESQYDWIGLFKEGSPNKGYIEYQKTDGKRTGTLFFKLPSTGLYNFRFFPNGGYLNISTSSNIYLGPQMNINASYEGGMFSFSFDVTNNEVISPNDWFALYRVGSSQKNYIASQYFKNLKGNEGHFTVNLKQGDYEVRYIPSECDYVHTQVSNAVSISGDDSLATEIQVDTSGRFTTIKAIPQISCSRTRNDWIGLFSKESSNKEYITYQYISPETEHLSFDCPTQAGDYDLRFFSGHESRYEDLVRSDTFTIANTDSVTVSMEEGVLNICWDIHSVEQTTYDWIGVYKASETNNRNYLKDLYINPKENSTLLPIPSSPGFYEVRYFSSNVGKYKNFRKSEVFQVE